METSVQPLIDCMAHLQRFFKIGIYYPNGHKVADQAAESLLAALHEIATEDSPFIRSSITESSFTLQGVSLDLDLAAVGQFHSLLFDLGIATLEIHKDINADEMRLFLSRLIFLRTKAQSAQEFQNIQITDLPTSVRVHQQHFLANESIEREEGNDSSQPTITSLLDALHKRGLTDQQTELCRQLLESIPDVLHNREHAAPHLPHASWDDVERLLYSAAVSLGNADSQATGEHQGQPGSIDTLIAFLSSLEKGAHAQKAHKAVDLIVTMLKGDNSSTEDEEEPKKPITQQHETSEEDIEKLKQTFMAIADIPLPQTFTSENRSEELSILLQILIHDSHPEIVARAFVLLHNCLKDSLTQAERRIVIRGTQSLLDRDDIHHLDRVLLQLFTLLRSLEHLQPLSFLQELCQGLSQEAFIKCWPALLNELFLSERGNNVEIYTELCHLAALVPPAEMYKNIGRLERYDGLHERKVHLDFFSPLPLPLKPLCGLLLNTASARFLYKQSVLGLQAAPQNWLERAMAYFLNSEEAESQEILLLWLHLEDPAKPGKDFKKRCAALIAKKLKEMPREERQFDWLPDALAAAWKLQTKSIRETFTTILEAKQYLLLPQWPSEVRKVVKEARRKGIRNV